MVRTSASAAAFRLSQKILRAPVVVAATSIQRRSFYMGGDAHIYAAAFNKRSHYVLDRPPSAGGVAGTEASASFLSPVGAGEATQEGTVDSVPISIERASSVGANSASTAAVTEAGGIGCIWAAYESTEFTPLEEVLLDITAWMIAILMCYDPVRRRYPDDGMAHKANGNDRPNHRVRRNDSMIKTRMISRHRVVTAQQDREEPKRTESNYKHAPDNSNNCDDRN